MHVTCNGIKLYNKLLISEFDRSGKLRKKKMGKRVGKLPLLLLSHEVFHSSSKTRFLLTTFKMTIICGHSIGGW